jgi:NDP-sugar pyrophosphorylase family protein
MKAMILAAGYGTRLRPVTYTLPKPIVPLAGRPLMGWAVEALLAAGISDFVVNLHHLPEPIERYLRDRYAGRARFDFSFEPEILGTGGGVRKVRPLLENDSEFFLVNGDTVQFPPYDALRTARGSRDALAALTLRHPPESDRFTPVYFDDGVVGGFGKGPGNPNAEALMFSGTHLISCRIFRYLPDNDFSGIVDEVYQPLIDRGTEPITGVIDDGLWFDIGTPQRYRNASRTLLDEMVRGQIVNPSGTRVIGDSLIHDTANVAGTISRSIAGERSVVEGAITDTVVWDDCRIARSAKLDGCIVAHGVEIASGIELRNVLICRDEPAIPRDGEHRFEHGLVLRDI